MQKNKERWMELCEKAAAEQDSKKLLVLTAEIARLLEEKQKRLDREAAERRENLDRR